MLIVIIRLGRNRLLIGLLRHLLLLVGRLILWLLIGGLRLLIGWLPRRLVGLLLLRCVRCGSGREPALVLGCRLFLTRGLHLRNRRNLAGRGRLNRIRRRGPAEVEVVRHDIHAFLDSIDQIDIIPL